MNTNIRFTLSTSIALGLVSFAITSAIVAGVAAPATLAGFGLLAVYGMIEIAVVSYEAPRSVVPLPAQTAWPRQTERMATVIEFPSGGREAFARAA